MTGPATGDLGGSAVGGQLARGRPIKQIGRRRRFWLWAVLGTLVMIVVTVGWAVSQCHNAGGWPTDGFTQSSWPHVPNVWNGRVIWPTLVWVLATGGYAWFVFGKKPVPESEIKREMRRQAGQRP